MLKELDEIDWEQLEHAYGSARDVPKQIRALASGDAGAIKMALYELEGNIYHQGTVYSASAPAVPFLAEALGVLSPPLQVELLGLLGSLAQGHGYYDVHRALPIFKKIMEETLTDAAATLSAERAIVRDTALAVLAQWDLVETYLDSPDRNVGFAALFLLSILARNDASEPAPPDVAAAYLDLRPASRPKGSWALRLRQLADGRLAGSSEPLERATWLRALLQVGAHDHPALQLKAAAERSALERYVVILSFVTQEFKHTAVPEIPGWLGPILADLADHHVEITNMLRDAQWPWGDGFDLDMLRLFALLPEPALEDVVSACVRLVAEAQGLLFHYDILLGLVLGRERPRIPEDPCLLSRARLAIAHAFLAEPAHEGDPWGFWHERNGNASAACAQFGVPHDRNLWLQWLKTASPSADCAR
jgi:hypothetical protein